MSLKHLFILIALIAIVVPSLALPSTPTVTLISGANVTFSTTGAATYCYFMWGQYQPSPEWITNNNTASGAYTDTVVGSPYWQNTKYYVKACDATGCSATASFTSGALQVVPDTTFGSALQNITANRYSMFSIISNMAAPFLWMWGASAYQVTGLMIVAGIILGSYFVALWISNRGVTIAIMVGIIALRLLILPTQGMYWGLTGEFAIVAEIACYLGIAGMIYALIKQG